MMTSGCFLMTRPAGRPWPSRLVEADHGRIETRTATVSTDIDWLQKDHQWPGLAAIGKVVRIRETPDKTTTETAYYLLSKPYPPNASTRSSAHTGASRTACTGGSMSS